MTENIIEPGDVILISLPIHKPKGHEQEGSRPAIVVGVPKGAVRYPVVFIIPLTTRTEPWTGKNPSLYPLIISTYTTRYGRRNNPKFYCPY